MKTLKWIKCLFWSLLALWTTSSFLDDEKADKLFNCVYNQFCHKRTFDFVRGCWLILAEETKAEIQQCTMSHCKINLPEYYSKEDLCGNSVSYSKKKECFYICLQKFFDYVAKLEHLALYTYSSAYQNLVHAKNCISPFLEICSYT